MRVEDLRDDLRELARIHRRHLERKEDKRAGAVRAEARILLVKAGVKPERIKEILSEWMHVGEAGRVA